MSTNINSFSRIKSFSQKSTKMSTGIKKKYFSNGKNSKSFKKEKKTLGTLKSVVNDLPESVVNDSPESVVNISDETVVNDSPESINNDSPEIKDEFELLNKAHDKESKLQAKENRKKSFYLEKKRKNEIKSLSGNPRFSCLTKSEIVRKTDKNLKKLKRKMNTDNGIKHSCSTSLVEE